MRQPRTQKLHSGQTMGVIEPVLDSVTVKLIHKFFRKAREYERVYLERRKAGKEVESAVKTL